MSGDPRNDPFTGPEWADLVHRVETELIPKLESSAAVVSLAPKDGQGTDVKFSLELGFSIMLDKPILVIAGPGQVLPAKLLKVADEVIYIDLSAADANEATAKQIQAFVVKYAS